MQTSFVVMKMDGIETGEESVAHTNRKGLRGNATMRRNSACPSWIVHRHIMCIIPDFGASRLMKPQCAHVLDTSEDMPVQRILPCHSRNEGYHQLR